MFLSGDHNSLVRAFLVYVRPILEYSSVVWSPCLNCEIEEVEKVQRSFTKRLKGLKTSSYSDRLCRLELPSLELRRLHLDLTSCYKLVFGLISAKFSDFFEFSLVQKPEVMRTNGINHGLTALLDRTRLFAERAVNVWKSTVNFASLAPFKRTITDVDSSRYMRCY